MAGFGVAVLVLTMSAFDQPPGTKVWDFYTGASIQSSVAIGHNGLIYFGTDTGKLYSFYDDGRGVWEYPTGDRIVASPAVGADGTIYIGSYDGNVYAMSPEGVERWRFQANGPVACSVAIGPGGMLVFGSQNNRLFALRPDGSKLWDLETSNPVVASPSISPDGTIYVPSADGVFVAIDARSGRLKWQFETPEPIVSSPAIAADGTIYFGCFDGHLYALSPTGKKKWTYATGGPVRGSPAIGPDGVIYFGSDDRQLYALAPDGFKKWTFTTGKWIRSTPAVAADGTVYVGSYDHSLYAVSSTGAKIWEFVTDANVTASPAIAKDGTVFFGSWNGRLYAVRGGSPLAQGGWPRFRGNFAQSGYLGEAPPPPAVGTTSVAKISRPAARPPKPEVKVAAAAKPRDSRSTLGNWWSDVSRADREPKKAKVAVKADPVPVAKTSVAQVSVPAAKLPNTVIKPVAAAKLRDSRPASGSWWTDIFGGDPKPEKGRVVASTERSPAAAVNTETVVVGQVREIANARNLVGSSAPSPTTEQTFRQRIDARGSGTIENTSVSNVGTSVIVSTPPKDIEAVTASAPRSKGGPIPMMRLIGGHGSGTVVLPSAVPRPAIAETRVISEAVRLDQGSATKVAAPVVKPPATNTAPATTGSGKLPMTPLIYGSGRSSVPGVKPALIKKVIEFPAARKTSFNKIETFSSTDVVASAPVTVETARVSLSEPQPQIEKLDVIERRLLPGLLSRTLHPHAAPKQYEEPVPEIDELSVKERTYLPGYFASLIKGKKDRAREHAAKDSARAENSAVVSVENATVTSTGLSTDTTTESKTITQVAESLPEIDELEVSERNYLPGYFTRLLKGEKNQVSMIVGTESAGGEDSIVVSKAVAHLTESRPEIDELEVGERNYLPGYFTRLAKGNKGASKLVAETRTAESGQPAIVSVTAEKAATIVPVAVATDTAPAPKTTIIADSSNLIAGESEIAQAWDEESAEQPGFFGRLFSRSSSTEKVAGKSEAKAKPADMETAPEANPAVVSVREIAGAPEESRTVAVTKTAPSEMTAPPPGRFDTKLALLEQQMTEMRGELSETRRERDELRRELALPTVPVVPVPKVEPVVVEERARRADSMIGDKVDPRLDKALAEAYGDKVSQLESHLISLNEELANARVERARLREDLSSARSQVSGIPVTEVRPAFSATGGKSNPSVPELDISQPAWLSNEVRSVIANADPWEQPPGSPAIAIPSPAPVVAEPTSRGPDRIVPRVIPNESAAVAAVIVPDQAAEPEPAKTEKRRKPGFFSRLFGRDQRETVATPATNIVIVPSVAAGSVVDKPTNAQLLGNDTRFGSDVVVTNFPRVPYAGGGNPGFIQPGAGNLTQLPGFPRPQPAIVPPPSREMDPTRSSPRGGIKDVRLLDSVPVLTRNSNGLTIEDLKGDGRPVVLIVSPADDSRLAEPVLDVRGMVKSRRRVAQVLVSVGGGGFVPAAGLENWSHQTPVKPGLVLVRVKAIDADGRESALEERTYHFNSSSTLAVEIVGDGRVNPDLNGRELQVGQPYELTAVPGAGSEFVGWSGAVTSSSPTLRFMMNNNLWLRAQFRPRTIASATAPLSAFRTASTDVAGPDLSAGRYTGLVYPRDTLRADRCGYFEMEVGGDGSYVGSIRLANSVAELRGEFDDNWQSAQSIGRPSGQPITINLSLDRKSGGDSITGGFDADGAPVVMRAYRVVSGSEANPVIKAGRYTLVIPSPPDAGQSPVGDGFGEVFIDSLGRLRFQGELPDGTRVSQESQISRNGVWPLYVPLYGGQGALAGWISVTNHTDLDLYGDLRWVKPASADDRRYPNGFSASRLVFGSVYQADRPGIAAPLLGGMLRGGDLGRIVLGDDLGGLPVNAPDRETIEKFSFNVDPTSGLVEGTFIHPKTHQPTKFRGMHVQKRQWSSGYFLGPDSSGMVHLQLK